MSEQAHNFRDFGILPTMLKPPRERVRGFFSATRLFGQYFGTICLLLVGLTLTVFAGLNLPLPLNVLACVSCLTTFGMLCYLNTRNDYQWVELDEETIRAKHLYARKMIERSISEIESLNTVVHPTGSGVLETAILEKLLGRVKAIDILFSDRRTSIRIQRVDPAMTNAQELIEALLFQMSQIRELDAEIVQYKGHPLVQRIYWKGEMPAVRAGQNLRGILVCLMILSSLFGTITAFMASQEKEKFDLVSLPPQSMTLDALIQNGPGNIRHLTLTDFRPGGFVTESKSGSWTQVWIPLFPVVNNNPGNVPGPAGKEIKAVLSTKAAQSVDDLKRLLGNGRVTVICSDKLRSSWGMTLGPELTKSNPGYELSSAWDVEEITKPPTYEYVMGIFVVSILCLTAVPIFAIVFLWKAN
jgi:hypothetical protein